MNSSNDGPSGCTAWQSAETPQISVIVPTLDRACRLHRLLIDLAHQVTTAAYEVIVVDNGSTDETKRVVDEACRRFGRIRYAYEPTRGASNARNRGIALAMAPIVAFVDDDVRATQSWVESIRMAFERHPDVDCVGGRVDPHWPRRPPRWLTTRMWGPVALQRQKSVNPYLDCTNASPCLISANFACRAAVLREAGGFSPAFVRDEDRELNLRLWRAGRRGLYEDAVAVIAEVPQERLEKRYHRTWHAVTGDSHARMRYLELVDRNGHLRSPSAEIVYLLGAPRFLYRAFATEILRWAALLAVGHTDDAFFHECRCRYLTSYLRRRWKSAFQDWRRRAVVCGQERSGGAGALTASPPATAQHQISPDTSRPKAST